MRGMPSSGEGLLAVVSARTLILSKEKAMKANLIKLLGLVLLLALASILVMCNTMQEERLLPAQENATVVEPDAAFPVIDMCDYYGTVVKLPEVEDECGLNIVLDEGELLYPYSFLEPFDLVEGQRVKLSYDVLDIVIPNCKGVPVTISCMVEVPDMPPPDLCVHEGTIHYFQDCGYVIKDLIDGTLYEPLNLKDDYPVDKVVTFGFIKVDAAGTGCGALPVVISCIR